MQASARTQLSIFRRQYLQLVDVQQLRWPEASVLRPQTSQSWIYNKLFNKDEERALPPPRYQLRILKALMARLEKLMVDPEEDEISDDLMAALADLIAAELPSELDAAQQKAYVTFIFPNQQAPEDSALEQGVTLLESRAVISASGTTGLRTWEAALHLGRFLTSDKGRAMVRGRKVFEIGAGTGLLSILCAKHLGAADVVATDGDEAVVDAIKTNSYLNGVDTGSLAGVRVKAAALKWGWSIPAATFAEDYGMDLPDIVLGADVTYDRTIVPALVATMSNAFDLNASLQVLIAATRRNDRTVETFLRACERCSLTVQTLPYDATPENLQNGPFYPTSTPIEIWKILRPSPSPDPFAF